MAARPRDDVDQARPRAKAVASAGAVLARLRHLDLEFVRAQALPLTARCPSSLTQLATKLVAYGTPPLALSSSDTLGARTRSETPPSPTRATTPPTRMAGASSIETCHLVMNTIWFLLIMLEPSLIQFYIADEGFKLAQRFVNDREGMGKFTEIIAVSRNRRHAAVKRTANGRASHA